MFKIEKYNGLVAAPFTPMDKNGKVNFEMIPDYYDFLEKNGVAGAFINGSTGEGASLTNKEREAQALKWSECLNNGGKMRVINMVGGTSYDECIEHALLSRQLGLSAIAMVAPYYFKPADDSYLAEFVARIGESVPDMPVYFYHIPVLTGVYHQMYGFLKKISEMLPNFAGIKYTDENIMDFHLCLNFKNSKYDLLWGRDECLLSVFTIGCRGVIGSTYNYAAPLYHKLIKAFDDGDLEEARRLQRISVGIVQLLGKYGGMGTGKAFMKYIGMDCGKYRLPVRNLTDIMYEDFVKDVEQLNMQDLFSKK